MLQPKINKSEIELIERLYDRFYYRVRYSPLIDISSIKIDIQKLRALQQKYS